jgi:hypothetical protein
MGSAGDSSIMSSRHSILNELRKPRGRRGANSGTNSLTGKALDEGDSRLIHLCGCPGVGPGSLGARI